MVLHLVDVDVCVTFTVLVVFAPPLLPLVTVWPAQVDVTVAVLVVVFLARLSRFAEVAGHFVADLVEYDVVVDVQVVLDVATVDVTVTVLATVTVIVVVLAGLVTVDVLVVVTVTAEVSDVPADVVVGVTDVIRLVAEPVVDAEAVVELTTVPPQLPEGLILLVSSVTAALSA